MLWVNPLYEQEVVWSGRQCNGLSHSWLYSVPAEKADAVVRLAAVIIEHVKHAEAAFDCLAQIEQHLTLFTRH